MNNINKIKHFDVCIIGAGQSGLITCKTFAEKHKNIIVLEKCNNCNGMFSNIKEKDYFTWSTSRYMSGFSDFPMDKSLGTWFTIQDYINYLQDFKKHFALDQYIQYGAYVKSCRQNKNNDWIIKYKINSFCYTLICKHLIVCTGLNNYQKFPDLVKPFTGEVIHTQDIYYMDKFQWSEKFENKKVLLIGGAESALDIGHLLVNKNTKLYFTSKNYIEWFPTGDEKEENLKRMKKINNPCLQILDTLKNEPTDLQLNYAEYSLPEPMSHIWHEYGRYMLTFVPKKYNCPKCNHGHKELCDLTETPNNLFKKFVVKRSDFIIDIYENKVSLIKYPSKIENKTIFYEKGEISNVDIIVCATGFKKSFPFLEDKYVQTEHIKKMIPVNTPNLAFIGFARPTMGSIASIAEMQSWWVYEYFYNNLPYSIRPSYFRNIDPLNLKNDHVNTIVIGCYYLKDLAKDMLLEPNMVYLFFTDYQLFTTIFVNSCHPMIYRIHGPKNTPESRDILMNTFIPIENKNRPSKLYVLFFIVLHLIYYIIFILILYLMYKYRKIIIASLSQFTKYFSSFNIRK